MASCIEHWTLVRSTADVQNARPHHNQQTAHVAPSINEDGFVSPILAGADHVIVVGHARLHAARKLGLSEVPIIVLDGLLENQRRSLIVADHTLMLNADWDEEAPHSNNPNQV
jgi:ParB-like chromosome segregation protein Spo0J